MFVYNLKINTKTLYKIIFIFIILFVFILCGVVGYKIYKETIKSGDTIKGKEVYEITNQNYSTILKAVHDDIDSYVGTKIKFSGYVYRVYDLNKEQFILGRNMIISSDLQTVIVGFLCHYKESVTLRDNCWVEIEGIITKGEYHGDMPIIEINNIKEIEKPNDEYVYPPDENYIPTVAMF